MTDLIIERIISETDEVGENLDIIGSPIGTDFFVCHDNFVFNG